MRSFVVIKSHRSLFHAFNKQLLSTYTAQGSTIVGTADKCMDKTDKKPLPSWQLHSNTHPCFKEYTMNLGNFLKVRKLENNISTLYLKFLY